MTPDQYCQNKAGASGSSFYYSFMFLPPERRRAITALYAFCREVDDIADECSDTEIARTKLAWWRQEIAAAFAGNPGHPVTRALAPALPVFGLRQQYFEDIIAGMEMDLGPVRYARYADLDLYCYRVASAVGLLAAAIFGYRDERTLDYARQLGLAFQLTNILRDVGEDARRDRIYLPIEDLQRFKVPVDDILAGRESEAFRALMAFQAQRAYDTYDTALAALPDSDRAAQLPGLIMAAIYRAVLDELGADGYRVLRQRISLTPLRKLWIAWRTQRREKRRVRAAA